MINTFRDGAKQMLVWSIVALILLVCVGLGVLYARWPTPRLAVGITFALCAFILGVVLPASGFGLAGGETRMGALPTAAGYLLACAGYSAALALTYWVLVPRNRPGRQLRTLMREVS